MKVKRKITRKSKNRMKISVILFFTMILPMMINTSIFSIISTDQDRIEKNPMDEYNLSTSSGGLPNADYFSYYKIITIDNTKVDGSGSHTNFPVLISIIDSDLDDKAQWDGDDIAFANSTAWLDHEIELYDPSYSGTEAQLIAWVRIPLLSTSSDTTIFMFYGNSTIGSQENPTDVWNSNYKGVWHLKEDPDLETPGFIKDSTSNDNDGTAVYMEAGDLVTGQIDGSFKFNEFSNELDHVSVGDVGPELINTVEFWMNADTLGRMGSTETFYMSPNNHDTVGPHNQWTNPDDAYTSNNIDASEPTNYQDQDWYDFGFSIPAGATVDGILVEIEGSSSSFGQAVYSRVRLSWDGGSTYTSTYKDTQSWTSTSDIYRIVGDSTDTWSRSWSPSDFDDGNFRIWLEKRGSSFPLTTLRVDHIRVKVYYSLPTDVAVIDLNGIDQIGIDYSNSEIKPLSFPSPSIYVNGVTGSTITAGAWYHVVITDTTGVSASALDIATNSSSYYQGSIDEFRLSNVVHSPFWIATEYNNQYDPNSFYSVGAEGTPSTDLQVNAIDLYGNPIPDVNISMYKNNDLIKSGIAGANGIVNFDDIFSLENKYNFTVSMTSNILPYKTVIINSTSEAILIEGASQTINLICNVSRNNFNVVDADGITVDSGWIVVGNSSDPIQNCTIDNTGQATFRWLNTTPYQYNYTVWYSDINYNPEEIIIGSGDVLTPNSDLDVITNLTTVNFTVITSDTSEPVSGVKLMLNNSNLGYNIVNFTTALDGKAIFRWVNSSGINSNYSLNIEFYGTPWQFEISGFPPGMVDNVNFSIKTMTAYEIKIDITQGELEEFETNLLSLNPTSTVTLEIGSILKLRTLFNVTKVPSVGGYEDLLGPSYADFVSYQIIEGSTTVHSGLLLEDNNYIGRHQAEVETDGLESNTIYIIKIQAQKSGYVLPPDVTMSLYLLENELILNQSQNDDSPLSVYWEEDVDMSVTPYGQISEDFTLEYNIYNKINPATFKFSIPDISNDWNLSKIIFNLYNISWSGGVLSDDINITIEVNDYGIFKVFNTSNHNGYNYALGTWTGIEFNLDKRSPTGDNNFEFTIGGTFGGTIDIIADASFIRDKINIQYERFNITDAISLLDAAEGWAIKNITFELYNCYNTSSWSQIDPTVVNLNISTNEGIKYALDSGGLGFGSLIIEDRIIYPLENQFLFTVESYPDIMFDVTIKVEYIQEFYQNHFLEIVNSSKTERGFSNGGTFQVSVIEGGWIEDQSTLLISEITDGIVYYLPSDLAMTITIGGIPYGISDVITGQGMVSLESLIKNNIYTAVIDTNQPTLFDLTFITEYSRLEVYETKGAVSYSVIENPTINGIVQYDEDLKCYLQPINTSLLNADDYTIRFSIIKENYATTIKDLDLIVLNRLTLLNGSSGFFREIENIYVEDAVNFTFSYTDASKSTRITDLVSQYYIWEKYDSDGDVVASGQGTLIQTLDDLYILDFTTENLTVGEYLLLITIGKDNYEFQNAMISLTVNKRVFDYSLKYNNRTLSSNQISVAQGKTVEIKIQLTDPTKGDISLDNATFFIEIGGNPYEIEDLGNGNYRFYFPTSNIDTFFSSKTLTGKINISKENYLSIEFTITIVVEMEVLFLGIPTFYFILISSLVAVFVGSIVGYRIYKKAKIPKFVKKVRSMQKIIEGGKSIPESLLYNSKESFVGERVKEKWDKIGLSLESIFGIELEKKVLKIERKISEAVKRREIQPIGLVLMKWDERVGTDILAKYPEEIEITEKTLMQIYSTHEYSAEKGAVTLSSGLLNIISYYTGPESGYYLLLLLKTEDDPDVYEGGMAATLRIILENIEDDSYLYMIPSLFQRLSLYPSLSDEEILALHYQDEIKRMILDNLMHVGVITKSELIIWLKEKYIEGFIDLDATLSELVKRDIIKQVSVKGLESELIVLTNDIFMLRVPPVKLVKDSINRGLPTQFAKDYLAEVKKFFQNYRPTAEDNLSIIEILINPQVYETLRLLRTAIITRQDLEKLKTKGVDDPDGTLKLLLENQMIKVFQDEKKVEYYALLSDFYLDLVFPKYLLTVIKTAYEQKSKRNMVLIEYLKVLEDTYFELKSQEKS